MVVKLDLTQASSAHIRNHVLFVVSEISGIDPDSLSGGMLIDEDIVPDSIDRITLLTALEDELGQSVSEQEVQRLNTLEDLVQLYLEKLGHPKTG